VKRLFPILLLVAAVVVAVVVYTRSRQGEERRVDVPPEVLEALRGPGPVAPGFHQETEALKARLAGSPADTAALRRLATLLQDAHQPQEAAQYWRRLLAISPDDRQAWLDLAHCAAETGDWPGSEQAMRSLLERHPDDLEAMYNLGAIRANAGDTAGARAWWRRVADQDEDPVLARQAEASLARIAGAAGG
jgi:Flp pilus assembly protein TadD